jgi:hypothetical protein
MLRMKTKKARTSSVPASRSMCLLLPFKDAPAHDNHQSDYAGNELLDTYSDSGLDDGEVFEPMSAAARRAAEAKMRQRDRMEHGSRRGMRAANRSHAPTFFDSDDVGAEDDDESGLLSGTRTRARRQYDERRDVDDMEGIEDVCFIFILFFPMSFACRPVF